MRRASAGRAWENMDATTQERTGIRWLPALIGIVAFVALGALIGFGLSQAGSGSTSLDLDPAPDFGVPLYSGGTGEFTLSDQRGRPVVLNFWASWCPPCRVEFPALQAVADQYKDKGVVVIGIAVQDTEADAKAFLREQQTTFRTGPDLTDRISIDYRIVRWPTTVFITKDGRIHQKWIGMIDETRLSTFIDELLQL